MNLSEYIEDFSPAQEAVYQQVLNRCKVSVAARETCRRNALNLERMISDFWIWDRTLCLSRADMYWDEIFNVIVTVKPKSLIGKLITWLKLDRLMLSIVFGRLPKIKTDEQYRQVLIAISCASIVVYEEINNAYNS